MKTRSTLFLVFLAIAITADVVPTCEDNDAFGVCWYNCTLSQGFWKTHPSFWPPGLSNSSFFLSDQTWVDVFDQTALGHGCYWKIAKHWIAAYLNRLLSVIPAEVSQAIDLMQQSFEMYTPEAMDAHPSFCDGPGNALFAIITEFNAGEMGVPHCTSELPCDSNPCTVDYRDPETGQCHVLPKNCTDFDPCTDDACNPLTGQCTHASVFCTDGNPCSMGTCVPGLGCVYVPIVCDDGDPCTIGDTCNPVNGECVSISKCGVLPCDPATGECIVAAESSLSNGGDSARSVVGPSSESQANSARSAEPSSAETRASSLSAGGDSGRSVVGSSSESQANSGRSAELSSVETRASSLSAGGDSARSVVGPSSGSEASSAHSSEGILAPSSSAGGDSARSEVGSPSAHSAERSSSSSEVVSASQSSEPPDCDDGNPCTVDNYDSLRRVCEPVLKNCTSPDLCVIGFCDPSGDGECEFVPKDCHHVDPCRIGFCDSETGNCESYVRNCSDSDPCTTDLCGITGCVHVALDVDDDDACTNDFCLGGFVINVQKVCMDHDPCTVDYCFNGTCMATDRPFPRPDCPQTCVPCDCGWAACQGCTLWDEFRQPYKWVGGENCSASSSSNGRSEGTHSAILSFGLVWTLSLSALVFCV